MFKYTLKPSTESLIAGGTTEFRLNRSITLFGKPIKVSIAFRLNADGTFDPRVCDAYNKFFCKLDEVVKSKMKMILIAVQKDNDDPKSKPVTEADIVKNFVGLRDCFVRMDRQSITAMDESGKTVSIASGDHIITHCSLEWKYDGKSNDNDFRFDAEHGNGFAMVDGKFYMGKPGDFY